MIKLAIFDLSGTTVEDDNAVAKCLYEAAKEFKLDVSLQDFERTIGTNKIHLYQFFLAKTKGMDVKFEDLEKQHLPELEDEAMTIFHRYTEIMIQYYEEHVTAMPGAEDTFKWCHANGIKVATDTGFHRDVTNAIMKGLQWKERGLIDIAIDVEHTGGVGRPAPFMIYYAMKELGIQNVKEVAKLGDTPADLLSGTNASVAMNIGVLSGANSIEVLGPIAHTHILKSVKDFPDLF